MTRLLVVGVPRSGTTWVGQALGHTEAAVSVHEPDGDHDPFAFRARLGHPATPVLDTTTVDADFERLFDGAFAGGRYAGTVRDKVARRVYAGVPVDERWKAWLGGSVSPRLRLAAALAVPRVAEPGAQHVIVKSVRSELAMDWLVARYHPRVVLVERNPLNVLASWIELDYVRDVREAEAVAGYATARWRVEAPGRDAPRLVHQAFEFGVLACALRDAAQRHGDWTVVEHEHLCTDPPALFRTLARDVGLTWGDAATAYLSDSDREGSGYQTNRRAADQPDRWRQRLDDEQVATIRSTLDRFPAGLMPRT